MNSGHSLRGGSLRLACGVLAATTATVLFTSTSAQAVGAGDFIGDGSDNPRVLQSVDVELGADGTMTTIDGSVIESTSENVEDADTSDQTFAPDQVAGQLPLRVMTSWRTEDGAGTDLADLSGYDGKVRLDFTVQNLTVRPQMLDYDVDGESRERAALVGVPLTVVAAADLGDAPADSVITAGTLPTDDVTNGVLGKGADDETQVQWATILAPPQLGSAARFSLVLDAKDFEIPDLDISVQPGLVTDPSLGALVDGAFNPQSSTEMALQRDTITTIGDVNAVLARASATIGDVRKTLSSSAETLGQQTVTDLQASTETVASNMKGLNGALESLRGDLSSTLKTTGSSAVAELAQAVDAVDEMLGDTSAKPSTPAVRGSGCKTSVAPPRQGGSVFGSLLSVASQLKGYAKATEACKGAVKQRLLTSIGPANPTEAQCEKSDAVTCVLKDSEQTFTQIADDLNSLTDTALELLTPGRYKAAITALRDLQSTILAITTKTGLIVDGRNGVVGSMKNAVYGPNGTKDSPADKWDSDSGLGSVIDGLTTLQNAVTTLQTDAGELSSSLTEMAGQAQNATSALCQLVASGAITDDQLTPALAHLAGRSCGGANLRDTNGDGSPDLPPSVLEKLQPNSAEMTNMANIEASANEANAQLAPIIEQTKATYFALETALSQRYGGADDGITFSELIDQLAQLAGQLDNQDQALAAALSQLQEDADDVAGINEAIDEKIAAAKETLGTMLEDQSKAVSNAGVNASNELSGMLDTSAKGLENSSNAVVGQARKSLEGQKRSFAQSQAQAGNRLNGTIEDGLSQISSGVSSSVRDMDAASALLVADLRKVLLDLGQRKVDGGGLLGAMTTSASTARSADYQLAMANDQTSSFSNIRSSEVDGILLRQEQGKAAMEMLAAMPAFELDLESGTMHRTVYNYRLGDGL